jgi:hypothetical protein
MARNIKILDELRYQMRPLVREERTQLAPKICNASYSSGARAGPVRDYQPRRGTAPSAAGRYDIFEVIGLIGRNWTAAVVADLDITNARAANILDQYLDAAIKSLRTLRRRRDTESTEESGSHQR